jgi:hypothetical protein
MSLKVLSLIGAAALAMAACGGSPAEAAFGLDDLSEALSQAGAGAQPGDSIEQSFFSVPGRILQVNGSDVQVFEYADAAAREAESSQIGPDGGSIGTTMVTWIDQPNFWAKGRLIVLYVGREAALITTLSAILGDPITDPWPTQG